MLLESSLMGWYLVPIYSNCIVLSMSLENLNLGIPQIPIYLPVTHCAQQGDMEYLYNKRYEGEGGTHAGLWPRYGGIVQ